VLDDFLRLEADAEKFFFEKIEAQSSKLRGCWALGRNKETVRGARDTSAGDGFGIPDAPGVRVSPGRRCRRNFSVEAGGVCQPGKQAANAHST